MPLEPRLEFGWRVVTSGLHEQSAAMFRRAPPKDLHIPDAHRSTHINEIIEGVGYLPQASDRTPTHVTAHVQFARYRSVKGACIRGVFHEYPFAIGFLRTKLCHRREPHAHLRARLLTEHFANIVAEPLRLCSRYAHDHVPCNMCARHC